MIVAASLPAWAGERPGVISGYVRDASGTPQMGAVVEIARSTSQSVTVFTDGSGFYYVADLLPGFYSIRVSAPAFLPALREKIGLHAGSNIHLNLTLSTLLDAMRIAPVRGSGDDDDWKWTLRSAANRPVLRFNDPASSEQQDHDLKASVAFVAGSAAAGYGSGSDASTAFSLERSVFSEGRVGLTGNVGYGDSVPSAVLRANYTHQQPDGSGASVAVTMRRFAPSDPNLHYAALQALALNAADQMSVGAVELKFGSQMQAIQFLGHATAFRPYGTVQIHTSPNTLVEYAYTTSRPNASSDKGLDSAPADLSETDPRISLSNFSTRLENAQHQELSISRRIGHNIVQLGAFKDRVSNTALLGAGEVTAAGGYLLPDLYSGTFTYTGGTLDTSGLRVVLEHKFHSDLTGTLDYAFGGTLGLATPDVQIQNAEQWLSTERRHALAAKLSGNIHRTHTRWIASYRWIDGPALTPVDMFNASPGQSEPFLNLFVRQPIPTLGFLPAHMDAIVDLSNLLAQGYVPVVGQDGQTVYLVQAARAIRGGVAITF